MRFISTVFLILFVVVVGIFCFQNMREVHVDYLQYSTDIGLPVVVLAAYVLGMLSGWSVVSFLRHTVRDVTTPRD
jgi:putative membrane protein